MFADPLRAIDAQPRGRAATVFAPASIGAHLADLAGPHQHDVARPDRHLAHCRGPVQVFGINSLARFEPLLALVARDVEQHAARDNLVLGVLHAVLLGAGAVDVVGFVAVVHLAPVQDVGERVPLRGALQRHGHRIVGVLDVGQVVLGADTHVAAVLQHEVDRVEAPERPGLRPVVVERNGKRKDLALFDEAGRIHDLLRGDVVERPELIVVAPPAPVLVLVGERLHVVHREMFRHGSSSCSGCVSHIRRRSVNNAPNLGLDRF